MTPDRRAAVLAASFVLEHVPDLVRYGSKPRREPAQLDAAAGALRTFDDAVAYPPNQVFIGNLAPEDALGPAPRPWWRHPVDGRHGRRREPATSMDQRAFYDAARRGRPVRARAARRGAGPGRARRCTEGGTRRRRVRAATTSTTSRSRRTVLLENLAFKASGVHALRDLLARTGVDPASITHAIGCGEEAVGDRYQRGGGNVAKAIAEACGLVARERRST